MATSILRLDGGSAITPKDEPFSSVILDLTNYANGDWWKGSIKGWVEEGFLHAYFYNAMLLRPNGGANFNEDSSWNNAEYKLNVPTDGIVLDWTPIHEFQTNNILGFMYAGKGVNAFTWAGNPQYEGSFPSGVTFASIDIPLDR